MTDLLVVVLIADAAQNAMADDYKAIPDGILLVAVIVFWAFALEWLVGYPSLSLVRRAFVPIVVDNEKEKHGLVAWDPASSDSAEHPFYALRWMGWDGPLSSVILRQSAPAATDGERITGAHAARDGAR